MLILPAIDIRGGRCVRLIQGDYQRELVYDDHPEAVAKQFVDAGATFLHVVDLDGAKSGEPQNWEALERVAKVVAIEVGGGVRSLETARRLLELGVKRVVVGSKLVQDEVLSRQFFEKLGDQVVAGIDARDGFVSVQGWTEGSTISAVELAVRVAKQGAHRIILTDIAKDGMMAGPNLDLLEVVQREAGIPVIQSGGIGSIEDVRRCAAAGPEGVIIGRAIYEGKVDIQHILSEFKNK